MSGSRASARRLQSGVAKLVGSRVFWVLFCGALFALPLGRSLARTLPDAPPLLGTVEPFELDDQYGHSVGTPQLRGKVWAVSFMSKAAHTGVSMEAQRSIVYRTRNLGSAFRLVTITTTPDLDTEAVRKEAIEHHVSSSQPWAFLGGQKPQVDRAIAAVMAPHTPAEAPDQIFLIDQHLQIRGIYTTDKGGLDRLMQDISYVTNFP
jgi:cytochrome oxidase Cu insertion factor (SCO1/SenC/PrrC family)